MKERIENLLKSCDRWFDEYFDELVAIDCYFIDQMHNEWRRAQKGKCTEDYAINNIKLLYSKLSGQTTEMKIAYDAAFKVDNKESVQKEVKRPVQLSLF